MITLFVTSLSTGAGKTAIAAGIARQIADRGKKVGYLRPSIGATRADGDAAFMKDLLGLQESSDVLCPAFANDSQFNAGIKKAFDAVTPGKDAVIIECASAAAARTLGAKALLVATWAEAADPKLTAACKALGQQGIGVIINKVPASQVARVRGDVAANLKKSGVNVLGVLAEDRALLTFSIAELAQLIDGKVVNSPEMASGLAESFMLGAMTVDSGLPYMQLRGNKVAVVRSGRPDMAMAALDTSTRAIVLSGTAGMIPQVHHRAEDKGVPIITTALGCAAIAGRIEEAVLKTRFRQPAKLPRLLDLLSKGADMAALLKAAGA